jgi:hypothetical protein
VFWQPFLKWQTSRKFWKLRSAMDKFMVHGKKERKKERE